LVAGDINKAVTETLFSISF